MRYDWSYTQHPGATVGLMICTACHKPIANCQFRYRETEEAYLPQHRACSEGDPGWARLDAQQAATKANSRIIDELETLISELSEGQEPSKPALLEAVRRSLHPLT